MMAATLDRVHSGVVALPAIAADADFRCLLVLCDRILARKGHDYTQGKVGDEGCLSNFYGAADKIGITPMQSLYNYLYKHLAAVETFVKKGAVESEPIEQRIADIVNYFLLLYKMIQYERRLQGNPALVLGDDAGLSG